MPNILSEVTMWVALTLVEDKKRWGEFAVASRDDYTRTTILRWTDRLSRTTQRMLLAPDKLPFSPMRNSLKSELSKLPGQIGNLTEFAEEVIQLAYRAIRDSVPESILTLGEGEVLLVIEDNDVLFKWRDSAGNSFSDSYSLSSTVQGELRVTMANSFLSADPMFLSKVSKLIAMALMENREPLGEFVVTSSGDSTKPTVYKWRAPGQIAK